MKIFKNIAECNSVPKAIITLGTYDGVHLGHQTIINQLNQRAKEVGGESVLLTFEPHPRVVLNKGVDSLQLLTTLDEKIDLMEDYGLQNLILHPFTKEFSELTADEFVQKLMDEIGIHSFIIGYDHHFGKNRQGNFEYLCQLGEKLNFEVIQIQEVQTHGLHISSTQARNALLEGDLAKANKILNRNYSLSGEVIHGDKIGRTLGFPTANLKVEQFKLIPGNGVYVVKVYHNQQLYKGLLSIGTRPTVTDSLEKRVEVNILDFDQEIYGEKLKLEFVQKIRDDEKFDSLDELVTQMEADKDFAKKISID